MDGKKKRAASPSQVPSQPVAATPPSQGSLAPPEGHMPPLQGASHASMVSSQYRPSQGASHALMAPGRYPSPQGLMAPRQYPPPQGASQSYPQYPPGYGPPPTQVSMMLPSQGYMMLPSQGYMMLPSKGSMMTHPQESMMFPQSYALPTSFLPFDFTIRDKDFEDDKNSEGDFNEEVKKQDEESEGDESSEYDSDEEQSPTLEPPERLLPELLTESESEVRVLPPSEETESEVVEELPVRRGEPVRGVTVTLLRPEEQLELVRRDYEQALKQGEALVKYGRVILLGPAAVGKTSLKHGLMNKQLPAVSQSTIIAEIHHLKPALQWAKVNDTTEKAYWEEVTPDHEITEITQLMVKTRSKKQYTSSLATTSLGSAKTSMFTAVDKRVKKVLRSASKKAINTTISAVNPEVWLHVWDCGGQPVFLDMLPAFLGSRTIFLLLFDASKDLNSKLEVMQHLKGTKRKADYAEFSVLSLLQQWMAVIYSHLAKVDAQNQLAELPRIIPIGTHGDKVDGRVVQEMLQSSCERKLYSPILWLPPLVVDNTTAGSGEHEDPAFGEIRKEVHNAISVVKTPTSWILFRKVLKKAGRNVMSYEDVCVVAAKCNISSENVPSLLTFYHELGVLLFYQHIKVFERLVIVNPTWLVEQLGKLFTLEGEPQFDPTRTLWPVLFEKGVLLKSLYTAVWKGCGIEPIALMELLVHLYLAAPVPPTNQHNLSGREKEYFVPCVLKFHHEKPSIFEEKNHNRSASLYVTFPTLQFVPPGFFSRLVTALASFSTCMERDSKKYRIDFDSSVYRSQITFTCQESKADQVVLTELPHAFQIDVIRSVPKYPKPFSSICQDLLSAVEQCCQQVKSCLYESQKTVIINQGFQPAMEIKWKYALICENSKCSSYGHEHYCYFSPGDDCLLCTKRCYQSLPSQQLWLQPKEPATQVTYFSPTKGPSTKTLPSPAASPTAPNNHASTLDEDDLEIIIPELVEITDIDRFGLALGLRMSALENIKIENPTQERRKIQVIYYWLTRKEIVRHRRDESATWVGLANAVDQLNHALSVRICDKYC